MIFNGGDNIFAFVHGTTVVNCATILREGRVQSQPGNHPKPARYASQSDLMNRGVFLQAIMTCNKGKPILYDSYSKEVMMVFSTKVLDIDHTCHISNNWFGWLIHTPASDIDRGPHRSYNISQLELFVSENEEKDCFSDKPFPKNELVIYKGYRGRLWLSR